MSCFSRRQVLSAGGLLAAAPFISRISAFAAHPGATSPLPLPALTEVKNGASVTLTMVKGRHSFAPGHAVASAGINAAYLGPLLKIKNHSQVTFRVHNQLGENTTLHWHGLHVPSQQDGGPHNTIASGADWNVAVNINQPPSFNWFHPHLHQDTARQTHMGLAGLMIVDDDQDRERGLPGNYGVDDFPLVLQDRRILDGNHGYIPDAMDLLHGFHGDKLVVNGAIEPTASVPAGLVRLRFLNGANARVFHLAFADRRAMHVIASDGGYLARTAETDTLPIAPGERYEVLVDFSGRQKDVLLCTSGQDNGSGDSMPLMRFTVSDRLKSHIRTVPQTLDGPGVLASSLAVRQRDFFMDDRMQHNMKIMMSHQTQDKPMQPVMEMPAHNHAMMHAARSAAQTGRHVAAASSGFAMAMTGKPFDMQRIDVEAKEGSYELWQLSSGEMMHPFHIHGASFRVVARGGRPPNPWEKGWKDTVLVNEKTAILVHFNRKGCRESPFMFHCHTLEHEDLGMMGQFITV